MKKRIVSLFMALVMALSLMPVGAGAATIQDYFENLPITAETEPGAPNSTKKWTVTTLDGEQVLMSGNKKKDNTSSTLQLTFTSDTHVTFEYKVSSEEKYDKCTITLGSTTLVDGESGDQGWKTLETDVKFKDVLTVVYEKDSGGDKNGDCVYLRNFSCGEGVDITFWNNTDYYTQSIFGGSGTLKACTFTDESRLFAGWATEEDNANVAYADGDKITNVTEPMSLYAVWADACVVTLKNEGEADETVKVVKGAAMGAKMPANPAKTGYTFGGWFNGEAQLTAETVISNNVIYTAKWTPITYTIVFAKGYDDVAGDNIKSITATYGVEVTLPACTYTRPGYKFNGWGTYMSATSGTAAGATVKNLINTQDATYTYYPAWQGNAVSVTFDPNYTGAETIDRTCAVGNYYTYIRNDDGSTTRSPVADPTREGYIFLGWYDAATDGSEVTTSYKFTAQDAEKDKTLYAHWVEAVTVTFDANGGSCSTTSKTIKKGDMLGSSLPSSYSVTRSGHKFEGWYTAKEGGTKVEAYNTKFDTNTTIYARWTAYKTTVSFNANGGTGSMEQQVIFCGSNTPLNACTFTRDGYIFKGWGTYGSSTTVKYADKAAYTETTSSDTTRTLYAIWEPTAEQKAANEELDKAESAISNGNYTPKYGTDTNALTMINAKLAAAGITDVTVTMKEAAYNSTYYVGIAADGTIQYKWNKNGTTPSANGYLSPTVVLTYNMGGKDYTKESTVRFSIPLDETKALAKLNETAARVVVPTTVEKASDLTALDRYVLKAGVEADGVDYSEYDNFETWATATWSCDKSAIIRINAPTSYSGYYAPYKAGVTLPGEDTVVTLTMTLTYNKNYSATHSDLSVTKTYSVTVKAGEDARRELYQAALDEVVTKVGLTNPRTGEAKERIDSSAVTSDIQFPTTRDIRANTSMTGFDGKYTPIVITSDNESVIGPVDGKTIANAARMLVYRPLPGEADKTVTVTMSILDRPDGAGTDYENMAVLASKRFTLTVKAMTRDEIDTAAAFMKKVCTEEVYWDCIRNGNTDKNNITGDLKWFKEILPAENEKGYTFITNVDDWNQCGVLAEDIPGWYDSQQYRAFRSSQPDIVRHENLLVTTPQYNTDVTIDSVLSYTEYAKYWEKFGLSGTGETAEKYKQFEQFYKQPVSVTVTVPGTTGKDDPNADKAVSAEVSIIGYGDAFLSTAAAYTYTAAKAGVNVTAWDAVKACLEANGYTYEGSGSYVSAITDKNNVTLGEKEHGEMSGWMFRVIRDGKTIVPSAVMANYSLNSGDKVEVYYEADGVKPIDPTRSADEVMSLIAAIGTVGLESEEAIMAARTAYDNLAVSEKAFVENYDVLAAAETRFAALTIDDIGTVDLTKGARIARARLTYNKLTAAQKSDVTNYAVLTAAETAYAELTAAQRANIPTIYKSTGDYILSLGAPVANGGEWMALGLARSGRTVPESYYDSVVEYVKASIDSSNGRLSKKNSNTNSLAILTLTALGKDVTDVGGYDLLKGLDSMGYIRRGGINCTVFALLALDSHSYDVGGDVTRDKLVAAILDAQVTGGGWTYYGDEADPDMTAMAIQALAPYYKTDGAVKTAVDKALNVLSEMQNESGSFTTTYTYAGETYINTSSESCAQVVTALTALGIDPTADSRFVKNGISVMDALCGFALEGGGFKHSAEETTADLAYATPQGYYALAAYYRFANKQNSLYDMTDVACGKHTFGAWTVTKAATCTEAGTSVRTCTVCGAEETQTIPALGHSMTATAGKAAACTEAGHSAYWSCSRCGKFFSDAAGKTEIAKDRWVIAALGHDEATRAAVAATCYASGHEADTYCKRCGMVINAGANIPATGKHTYVNGVCTVCGVKNPTANVKTDDIKVDSKNDTLVKDSSGLVIKAEVTVDDEKLMEIKAAVESGSITVKVDNEKTIQTTDEQKKTDGGKSALESAAASAAGEVKNELTKLIDKLADMRKDNSGKKDAQIEKVVDVAVELVKTVNEQVTSVAQLIELPQSVTVTISITDEMYNSLLNRKVCVVRSHTDASGNVTTTELPAYLGGTEGNRVLSFQTDKASTFAIVSYETTSTGGGSTGGSGSITVVKATSANTADDSQMVIWLGSAVMAAAAVVVLTRKQKRVSK